MIARGGASAARVYQEGSSVEIDRYRAEFCLFCGLRSQFPQRSTITGFKMVCRIPFEGAFKQEDNLCWLLF